MTLLATAVKLALAAALLAGAAPLKVTLTAPGHAPRVKTHWKYAVHATRGGRPVAAKLTAQIVDPIGGKHAVLYGTTKKKLVNWPFFGTFRDFVIWPASSRGIPLTLRLTVVSGGAKRVVNYAVIPRR